MVDSKDVSTKWAVLLGINAYPVHPLGGCVRDVSRIHNYLTSASTRVNVTALTASPANDSLSSAIIESPSSRPTYKNVVSKLDEIADKATPGNHVYIHFSGHGTRNKLTGDFNLVLLDDDQDIRYLGGHHLAELLSKLVDKGLHVTLVLDCCFSGGILRQNGIHDPSVRTIEYDPCVDARHPPAQLEADRRAKSTLRDVTILPRWLIDPRGYTVLTACGPHEKAQEHRAEDGEKCGVLSHFLVQALIALRKRDVKITNESLYRYISLQVSAYWRLQNPICYGDPNFQFFGNFKSEPDLGYVQVLSESGSHLRLQAGLAHGVNIGDEYALFPLIKSKVSSAQSPETSRRARVTRVWELSSDLSEINAAAILSTSSDQTDHSAKAKSTVKTGWKAVPLTTISISKVVVFIPPQLRRLTSWVSIVHGQTFRYLAFDTDQQKCTLCVSRNAKDEYEIQDSQSLQISGLPVVSATSDGAENRIVSTLAHIAAYKFFEKIENRCPDPVFENSFRLKICDSNGSDLTHASRIDIRHEGILSLVLENFDQVPRYLSIFHMGPKWQIVSLLVQKGGSSYKVVEPKSPDNNGIQRVKWRMKVPEGWTTSDRYWCDDILKVFVTSKPCSFAQMLLGEVSSTSNTPNSLLRGEEHHMASFLQSLTSGQRHSTQNGVKEQWCSRNFLIRTTAHGMV